MGEVERHMAVSKVVPLHPKDDSRFDSFRRLVHSAVLSYARRRQYSYSHTPVGRFDRLTFPSPCEQYYHRHDSILVDVFACRRLLRSVPGLARQVI